MSGGLSLAQRPSLDEPARSARCSHPRPSDASPSKLDPKAPAGNPYYDLEVSPTTEVALAGMRPVDRAQEQKWGTQRGDTEAGLDRRAPSHGRVLTPSRPKSQCPPHRPRPRGVSEQ